MEKIKEISELLCKNNKNEIIKIFDLEDNENISEELEKAIKKEANKSFLKRIYHIAYLSNDDKYERDIADVESIVNILNE